MAPSGRIDPKFCMHRAFGMLIPKIKIWRPSNLWLPKSGLWPPFIIMSPFGGQRSDSLQIYILGISIPNAQCMQNLGSIRPLGSILGLLSHIKRSFAVPLFKKKHENLVLGLLLLLLKKTLELVKNVTFWVNQKKPWILIENMLKIFGTLEPLFLQQKYKFCIKISASVAHCSSRPLMHLYWDILYMNTAQWGCALVVQGKIF